MSATKKQVPFFFAIGQALLVSQKDPRQKRLKALVRAHIGESLLLRRQLKDRLDRAGFPSRSFVGRLNGFASFSEHEMSVIEQIVPFTPDFLEGRVDMFGAKADLHHPLVPLFFTRGNADVGQRLHQLLYNWPEATDPATLLFTLCNGALASVFDAELVLSGDKPLGLWALNDLWAAYASRGAKPLPTTAMLLDTEAELPVFAYTGQPLPLASMTSKLLGSVKALAALPDEDDDSDAVATPKGAKAEPEAPLELNMAPGTEADRMKAAIVAYCGNFGASWDDLSFEMDIDNLHGRVSEQADFSFPERMRVIGVLDLRHGYLTGRESLVGAPLAAGKPSIPVFFIQGDRKVGKALSHALTLFAPEAEPHLTLMKIVGAEIGNVDRARAILRGNSWLSWRGIRAFLSAWKLREADWQLTERELFEYPQFPERVWFGKPF